MMTFTARRRAAALITAVAFALGTSACASEDAGTGHGDEHSTPATVATEGASADVTFVQGMIPHHRQALEMAALAPGRAGAEVAALAGRISAAQDPEIATMTAWLERRGKEVPSDDGHTAHGGTEGMMTPEDLARLEGLDGEAFDQEFLRQMIEHHEGAVAMAEDVRRTGSDPEVADLAQQVSETQRAEVEEMRGLSR